MQEYKFEIEYLYQPDKDNPARVHWIYWACKAKTLQSAKKQAEQEYRSRMAGLGWTKITTLVEIRPPKRANDPLPQKSVSADTLPAKRTSSSSTSNAKRKPGTKTGSSRRTTTTKRKPKA